MSADDKRVPFDDAYARLTEELAVAVGEPSSRYGTANRSLREEIVRCVWFGTHLPAEGLCTDGGARIEILSPGWWNVEGGPDFARAEFLLEGEGRVVGDVEVHTLASSWHGHGHDRQPEYDAIALHVAMWNDTGEDHVLTACGRRVPQLTLERYVTEDLEELVELVDMEGEEAPGDEGVPGRFCTRAFEEGTLQPQWMGHLFFRHPSPLS